MKSLFVLLGGLSLTACGLMAQSATMSCKDQGAGFCEVRESTISATGTLTVDGKQNGGISIKGANRSDVLVRAMVQSSEGSETDARTTAAQVILHTAGGTIAADGPSRKSWSVSYEIFVPAATNLSLTARNGGISISSVTSSMDLHAVNGGISLKDVGGNIRGETMNGGISATLAGRQWNGQGLDVSTKNGGVSLRMPESFSALLDVSTVNGGMSVHLPRTQVRSGEHKMNMTLGSGGPLIRVRTQNGGVSISSNGTA